MGCHHSDLSPWEEQWQRQEKLVGGIWARTEGGGRWRTLLSTCNTAPEQMAGCRGHAPVL